MTRVKRVIAHRALAKEGYQIRPKTAKIPIGRAGKQEEKGQKQGKISQNPYSGSQKQTKMTIFNSKKGVLAYEPLPKVPVSA